MQRWALMRSKKIVLRTFIRQPVDAVYKWHLQKKAILRGLPSWQKWSVISEEELEGNQIRFVYLLKSLFCSRKVVFRLLIDSQKNVFRITQEKGPVKRFALKVELRPHSIDACEVTERIEFSLKNSWFFRNLREKRYAKFLKAFFSFRHETMLKDLEFHQEYNTATKKRVLISGVNGLIGGNLKIFLECMGHEVHTLTRNRSTLKKTVFFDDRTGEVEIKKLENFDAVIHLRGQKVFARWTEKKKKEITRSRVDATKKLVHHLASLSHPPKVFIQSSAIGIYGDRGSEKLDEKSECGERSFLSNLTKTWEESSKMLIRKNIRVVHLRFGLVLSMNGGALPQLVWPIRLGVSGALGDGKQYVSWITLDDTISSIIHCMFHNEIAGPVNVVSPSPITNREISTAIANYYKRQLGPKVPASIIRLVTAEMGDELLLSSSRCYPNVLNDTGFRFRYPVIKEALNRILKPC